MAQETLDKEEAILAQYAFTLEVRGTTSTESPAFNVLPSGIQIYFMRYGLARDNLDGFSIFPEKQEPNWQTVDGAPDIAEHKYIRTGLRSGWIYIYSETKNKLFRFDTDDIPVNPFTLKKNETIWVAYSEIEWSKKYEDTMCGDSGKRTKRMQKICWSDCESQREIEHGVRVDQVNGVFDISLPTGSYLFQQQYKNAQANDKNLQKKDYLFFCLHDPLAIADELTEQLNLQWIDMEALIISMQTGLEHKKVVEALLNGKDPDQIQKMQETEKAQQFEALFKSSLLLFHSVLSHKDHELKEHLDRDRILKLLASKERDLMRKKIKETKERLVTFLKSDYYQNSLIDYLENEDEKAAIGKKRISTHSKLLQYRPNEKDKYLDTAEENEKWKSQSDSGREYKTQITLYNNITGALLKKKTVIDVFDIENSAKTIGLFNSLLGGFVEYTDQQLKKTTNSFTILNSVELRLQNGKTIKVFDEAYLSSIFHKPPLTDEGRKILNLSAEILEKKAYVFGIGVDVQQLKFTTEFELELKNQKSPIYKFANSLQHSQSWNRFMAGVACVNLVLAGIGLLKSNGNVDKGKNGLKVLGSLSDAFAAYWQLKLLRASASGADELLTEGISSTVRKFSARAAFLGATVDLVDAGINFSEKDYDAGFAYTASAVCGTLLGFGVLAGWNPLGMISLVVAGFGFGILAIFLEDPPFEQLIKNCPLSKIKGFKEAIAGDYYQCLHYHLDNNKALGKISLKVDWSDFTKFYEELTDLIFAGRVSIDSKQEPSVITGIGYTTIKAVTKSLKIEITLAEFIQDHSELQCALYFFPYGIENKTGGKKLHLSINSHGCNEFLLTHKDGMAKLTGNYIVPKDYNFLDEKHKDAVLIFLYRTIHGKMQVWPIEKAETARYMAAKIPVIQSATGSSLDYGFSASIALLMFGEQVRTGTSAELWDPKYWKKKI